MKYDKRIAAAGLLLVGLGWIVPLGTDHGWLHKDATFKEDGWDVCLWRVYYQNAGWKQPAEEIGNGLLKIAIFKLTGGLATGVAALFQTNTYVKVFTESGMHGMNEISEDNNWDMDIWGGLDLASRVMFVVGVFALFTLTAAAALTLMEKFATARDLLLFLAALATSIGLAFYSRKTSTIENTGSSTPQWIAVGLILANLFFAIAIVYFDKNSTTIDKLKPLKETVKTKVLGIVAMIQKKAGSQKPGPKKKARAREPLLTDDIDII